MSPAVAHGRQGGRQRGAHWGPRAPANKTRAHEAKEAPRMDMAGTDMMDAICAILRATAFALEEEEVGRGEAANVMRLIALIEDPFGDGEEDG